MTWDELQFTVNRALRLTPSLKKLLFTLALLLVCGLVIVFGHGIALHTGSWVGLSLNFLPLFIGTGVLMAGGIVLVRVYHDEVKDKPVDYQSILTRSWQLMIGASYFILPIILAYLLCWIALGLFFLLREIPYLGDFVAVVLAFGPFLLNLTSLLLGIITLCALYFVTPILGLRGLNRTKIVEILAQRILGDPFSAFVQLIVGLVPAFLSLRLLHYASWLTGTVGFVSANPTEQALQAFFIMIPYAALLVPSVIFFFNFATEAHVLSRAKRQEGED